jgi:predicted ATPase
MLNKLIIVSGYNYNSCLNFLSKREIATLITPENNLHYIDIREHIDKYLFKLNLNTLGVLTFSDFVITYIRRLIAEEKINYKNVDMYFIEKNENVINIEITKMNGLSVWPVGFGDGMEIELCKILKARKC